MTIQIKIDDKDKAKFLLLEKHEKVISVEINDSENDNPRYAEIPIDDFKRGIKILEDLINEQGQ